MKEYSILFYCLLCFALPAKAEPAAVKSMPAAERACPSAVKYFYPDSMLYEGFEDSFPAPGWDTLEFSGTQGGPNPIPWTKNSYYAHTDSFSATYGWGYALDGWLRILSLDLSQAYDVKLSFWWISSYTWHVYPYDNGDLFVEVSTDVGTTWDTLWTFGDSADVVNSGVTWPWEDWVWYHSTIDLNNYAALSGVFIGFHVVADDNADIAIDDVVIDTLAYGIYEEEQRGKNAQHRFLQIQPNPVSTICEISFYLPYSMHARLSIYDVTGQRIIVLKDTIFNSGWQHVIWDKKNASGTDLVPGVYFCQLESEFLYLEKKIIVLK